MREFLTVEYRLPRWGEPSRPHSSGERRRRHAHGAQLIDGVHGVVVGKIEPFTGRRDVQNLRQETQGWRLAEMRKRRGLTQTQVADRMGISVARVSQIENGDVSTREVLDRYVAALDGTLKLVADFGQRVN
ncbi:helix-turn-helix transcriptional regulator [Streptosporangium sp. NPDC002544]|uniref:helix-turn-helix domain-containing protein n=1 Tax=Streptosporangium sp. NPDC002544 TaxID=3154538 RepID=UPI003330DBE3